MGAALAVGRDAAPGAVAELVQQSLLVAVPIAVGSLGRIPVGALADRLGARWMFPAIALLTMAPVLYLGHLAGSLAGYLAGGFFLGLAGTTFAIGIPFVNSWYPPQRRGLALGIFGAGMGGTAISAFSTVQLARASDPACPLTWSQPSSVYLPTYLTTAYHLDRGDAALRTAGFIVLPVAMRPVGGWLSDRAGPGAGAHRRLRHRRGAGRPLLSATAAACAAFTATTMRRHAR